MEKISFVKATTLFLVVLFISASLFQCKKEGDLAKNLDRSFIGKLDSALYASFYESNTIATADAVPDVNDVVKFRGVQTIVHEYCSTSGCHGGSIAPKLDTYSDIMKYVSAGNPEGSKLWEFLTTNDFNKAMPPVNSNHEMNASDKALLYNWIKKGAKEKPDVTDFRPAAIALIATGCASVNCHSQSTATGAWARKGWLPTIASSDTTNYIYTSAAGSITNYCLLTNAAKLNEVWSGYKDSVRRFYADTINNLSFKPYKTFSTRGPLASYDDIILDILYPKSIRSTTVRNSWKNSNDCLIRRMDSTLIYSNVYTGAATSKNGSMAYQDGGCKPAEVALIKAWYFADESIPDYWKYGNTNAGIFKYIKTGNVITKK
jgi:hypothetical protein